MKKLASFLLSIALVWLPHVNAADVTAAGSPAVAVSIGNVSGLGTGVATMLGTPSSANLASALTDETGTGAAVFAGSPALTGTPTVGSSGSAGAISFGNATSGTITLQPVTGALGTTTLTMPAAVGTGRVAQVIASGAKALATGAISSATCTSAQTDTATGAATTDTIIVTFSADPTSTTGYAASASGGLHIVSYPTADTANFKVCNNTGSSVTPGAVTLNWRIIR